MSNQHNIQERAKKRALVVTQINEALALLDEQIGDYDEGDIVEVEVSTLQQIQWCLLGALGGAS